MIGVKYDTKETQRKHKDVAGPFSLSVAKGAPRSLHNDMKMSTLRWHTWDSAGPIIK